MRRLVRASRENERRPGIDDRRSNQRRPAFRIETGDQLRRLQAQHCNTGQGYLIARPMAADRVTDFLQTADATSQAQRA